MVPKAIASLAAILSAVPSQAAPAAEQPAVPTPNPNQLTVTVTPQAPGAFGLFWRHQAPTCDSGTVEAVEWVAPQGQFAPKVLQKFPVTMAFNIDRTGRAIDIRVVEGGYVEAREAITVDPEEGTLRVPANTLLASLTTRDLMPSLRASRFASGTAHTGCRIIYTPEYVAADELTPHTIAAIGAAPGVRLLPPQLDRIGGGDCNASRWPDALLAASPDWRKVSGLRGTRKWTWISFDIDAEGVPANVAVVASSGHEDLDAEARRAVGESRFAGGPRTGCVTSWWRNPLVVPAPSAPAPTSFAGYRDCKTSRRWAVAPKLVYPQPYNERAIEGWAMLGFDVGADGAIGNLTVLAAQPSEEFARAGMAVLRSVRLEPSEAGQTGCIERVRFAMEKS